MKKSLRIILIAICCVAVIALISYRIWFYNPYNDRLYLNSDSLFLERTASYSLLIRNTNVIDVINGETIRDVNVLIREDTIAGIFYEDDPGNYNSTVMYDGRNQFIMPGLFDVHTHLAMYWHLVSGNFKSRDSLVTKVTLEQFVRYGVTTILVLGGGGANNEQLVKLKKLERNNKIVSPQLFGVGNLITVPGSHPVTTIMRLPQGASQERLNQAGVTVISKNEDPTKIIARKKQMGLDGVKIIIESGPPPFYPNPRMGIETAREITRVAKKYNMPVYVHTESLDEFSEAVTLDIRGVMHSVSDTLISDNRLILQMKKKNIWYIPTLSLLYGFQYLDHPERLEDDFLKAAVSKRAIKSLEHPLFRFGFGRTLKTHDISQWLENSMQNLSRLHEEGIQIALGTDASTPYNFPGYSVHTEMILMSEAGLSNAEVLRIATVNSARFLGIEDNTGTISKGNVANMLVLKKNPLKDIRNTRTINKILLKGRLIDPGYPLQGPD